MKSRIIVFLELLENKLLFKIFKSRFYKKYKSPKDYYVNILGKLNDDYYKLYFGEKL